MKQLFVSLINTIVLALSAFYVAEHLNVFWGLAWFFGVVVIDTLADDGGPDGYA